MKLVVLKNMRNLIYYNARPAKLTPNVPQNAKKCELGNKIRNSINQDIKKHQMYHIKQSKYNTNADINYSQALIDKQKLRLKALMFCTNDDILYTYV